jgi:hypothetical protein
MIPTIEKYLTRYLEPEGRNVRDVPMTFGQAIVIPSFDEGDDLFHTLRTIPAGPLGETLTVLVVNTPADAAPSVHVRSQQLIESLGQEFGSEFHNEDQGFIRWFPHPRGALLCVDRTGPRSLPAGKGVGLARKIGCDIALQLHVQGKVRSPWIHTTDADVILPDRYLEMVPPGRTEGMAAALLYPFWHRAEPPAALTDAINRYEVFLRYYVLGLTDAGSPYAFHTLGSTLAVHAVAYAQVRGFPRRSAGEDFYLLNKLAKVGRIIKLAGEPLMIRGRWSHRVPFGTGAALKQIAAGAALGEHYRVYSPEVFLYLKAGISALQQLSSARADTDPSEHLRAAARAHAVDPEILEREMSELGFLESVRRAHAISPHPSTMARHLHTWFDAFRTLKLIHRLTRIFSKRDLIDAVESAPFLRVLAERPQNLEQLRYSLLDLELQTRNSAT